MLHYIIQIVAFQLFFLVIYDVFLKKETFFNWNRAYLLITTTLSLLLPFIKIDRFKDVVSQEFILQLPEVVIGKLSPIQINPATIEAAVIEPNFVWSWTFVLYLGMAISALIVLFKIIKIILLIHKNPKRWKNDVLIIKVLNSTAAFSFFYYIFLGEKINKQDRASILKHELIHVKQKHTIDLLFFEALRIIFWFNPLIYMYQNRIAALHEFIADAKAVKTQSKSDYYEGLLSQVFETQNLSFVNPFFKQSLIKKRIIMLSKSKSRQINLFKYILLIPMVLGMLLYTSADAQETEVNKLSDEELKRELNKELINMKVNGATYQETFDAFMLRNDNYIINREDYYRFQIYLNHLNNKSKKEVFKGDEHILNRSYKDYLKFKATDDAKEIWEGGAHDGDLRLVVNKMNNLTAKEKERLNKKEKLLYSDDYFKQLVITDGETTEKIIKNNKALEVVDIQDNKEKEVPFAVIDQVPVYPGCESLSAVKQKKCISENIAKHVGANFNTKLGKDLDLTGRVRIMTVFKINKEGAVERIRARAEHPELEQEAIRVLGMLPKMKPGQHKGKAVIVPYSLPIIFEIKSEASEQTTTPLIEKMIAMRKQVEIQGNVSDKEQKGFDLLLKTIANKEFDSELVKNIQAYTSIKKKTPLMQKITDVFEQIQAQGNVSKQEEEALKGFLMLVTDNGMNNPVLQDGIKHVEIPYGVIEQVPIFPGCEDLSKDKQKNCMVTKITQHVVDNFNTKLGKTLNLKGRIRIVTMFKINSQGKIVDAKAKGAHKELEEEAIRVISMLPTMKPGQHDGKTVTVPYSLPIVFEVQSNDDKDNQEPSDDKSPKKDYDEIPEKERSEGSFLAFPKLNQSDSYINTKGEYYKSKTYLTLLNERMIKKKIEEGEALSGMTKLLEKRKNYEEYLDYKKKQADKEKWIRTF